MIKLQTTVQIPTPNFRISHHDKILSLGSCFAENMSIFFKKRKFNILSNPFGILYHPLSISRSWRMIFEKKTFQKSDLFYHNELWHSFDHHSDFSGLNVENVLHHINNSSEKAVHHLQNTNILIITLGAAFVYFKKSDGEPVANCHKVPSSEFEKRLLSKDEITASLSEILTLIQQKLPKLHIIFTISPIRHIRDGIIENQQSKATLVLAVHQLVQQFSNAYYFPSYEIVLDELRDYRFYAKDLVHLNEIALEYIWQRFSDVFFDEKTQKYIRQFEKLNAAFEHRPFQPTSEQHQAFLKKQLGIALHYQEEFPMLDFQKEIKYFQGKA